MKLAVYVLFPVELCANTKFFVGVVVPFPVHPLNVHPVFVASPKVISLSSYVYVAGLS